MRTLLPLLPLLAGCGVVFERSSEVVDFRVLAIQAEPPELLADGTPPPVVKVRALTVDPRDPARVMEQEWRACAPALSIGGVTGGPPGGGANGPGAIASTGAPGLDETPDGRCSEQDVSNRLSMATAPIGELQVDVPVPATILEQVAAIGASGAGLALYLTTQLRIVTPEGPVYTIKRIPVAPPVPATRRANRNPHLIGVAFEGEAWEPGRPVKIKRQACKPERRQLTVYRTNVEEELELCAYKISPLFDPAANETYANKTFDGREIELRERMRFQWFVDHGGFSNQRTDEPNLIGVERADPTGTYWREPPEPPPGGRATFWIVMRDGRGGTTWTSRELVWE